MLARALCSGLLCVDAVLYLWVRNVTKPDAGLAKWLVFSGDDCFSLRRGTLRLSQ